MPFDERWAGQALTPVAASNDGPVPDNVDGNRRYLRAVILVFALNILSAAIFIVMVNDDVYDETYSRFDVHTYATQGVSIERLRAHKNLAGPTSYIWMAMPVRAFGGDELVTARFAVLASWVLLVITVMVVAARTSDSRLWYGALLALMVFPHTPTATATLLTEGPALLFGVAGALAWTEFIASPNITPANLILGFTGGLSIGIAVTCRQYNLAFLPAVALLGFFKIRSVNCRKNFACWFAVALSMALAIAPVIFLLWTWKGFTSPSMAAGTSYQEWRAGLGFTLFRPVIAALYVAIYLIPLTFPAMLEFSPSAAAIGAALLGGILAGYFNGSIIQLGPLHTLVQIAARVPGGVAVLFGVIVAAAIYNGIAFGSLLWKKRSIVFSSVPVAFALLTVIFFVIEQAGVGGNVAFYDRYVMHAAPFLALAAFAVLPRLTFARLLPLAVSLLAGQIMLWRYALSFRFPA